MADDRIGGAMAGDIERDTLVRRIAAELHDMSRQTACIEDALAAASRDAGGTVASDARQILQEIDRLRQTQAALASCLETVARSAPSPGRVSRADLLDGSVLLSVAERLLSGGSAQTHRESRDPEIW